MTELGAESWTLHSFLLCSFYYTMPRIPQIDSKATEPGLAESDDPYVMLRLLVNEQSTGGWLSKLGTNRRTQGTYYK